MAQDPLRDHLDYFQELGVDGIHPEPLWRARPESRGRSSDRPADERGDPADNRRGEPSGSPEAAGSPQEAPVIPITAVRGGHGDSLPLIKADIGPDCTRCKLHTLGRKQVVFGVGNPTADLMFVGEAPGADEDIQGEPFVGRAGQLLTKIIEAINLRREDVYIANVIKCRPPQNRNPEPDEVEQCEPFLFRQIDAIKPKVIVALGKFAAQSLLKTTDPITRIRGREYRYRDAILMPTYHPAYLLRNPSSKREVWEDMKRVRDLLAGAASRA
jgi:uracil-DNA glycosylase family 4